MGQIPIQRGSSFNGIESEKMLYHRTENISDNISELIMHYVKQNQKKLKNPTSNMLRKIYKIW